MEFERTTEKDSDYHDLENSSLSELLKNINREDQAVPGAVKKALPQIELLTACVVRKLQMGGRLFYIGAGTSGRLGVLDSSECPPTFGVSQDLVIGLIAGGDKALRKAEEFAEDDSERGWKDLQNHHISARDVVIGIAASGTTPYVVGAVEQSRKKGIPTGGVTCNEGSPLARAARFPVEVNVGAEFVTGSSRMKGGTAQKLILNMISTAAMIRLGKVKDNKMVDMQLSNEKLRERGIRLIREETGLGRKEAEAKLKAYGSVRKALKKLLQ